MVRVDTSEKLHRGLAGAEQRDVETHQRVYENGYKQAEEEKNEGGGVAREHGVECLVAVTAITSIKLLGYDNHVEDANRDRIKDANKEGEDVRKKIPVVALRDARPEPGAVVVEDVDATAAGRAVPRARRSVDAACGAVLNLHRHTLREHVHGRRVVRIWSVVAWDEARVREADQKERHEYGREHHTRNNVNPHPLALVNVKAAAKKANNNSINSDEKK